MPARVASITVFSVRLPAVTQPLMAPLVTPLQLQTCMFCGISSIVAWAEGAPMSNNRLSRSSGSGVLRSKACVRYGALLMSPSKMLPSRRPLRMISFLYVPFFGSVNCTTSSPSSVGSVTPIEATSTPITFSRVEILEPRYAALVSRPVR